MGSVLGAPVQWIALLVRRITVRRVRAPRREDRDAAGRSPPPAAREVLARQHLPVALAYLALREPCALAPPLRALADDDALWSRPPLFRSRVYTHIVVYRHVLNWPRRCSCEHCKLCEIKSRR